VIYLSSILRSVELACKSCGMKLFCILYQWAKVKEIVQLECVHSKHFKFKHQNMKKLEGIWCFTVFVMIMNFCVEILNGMKTANMSIFYIIRWFYKSYGQILKGKHNFENLGLQVLMVCLVYFPLQFFIWIWALRSKG